ncbi:MAG: SRPBCC domain-containing protein [Sphingobacterium sp.]|uniref:SRPBCC domain-containing protein n=1 Tax=Sphingobacterium sp. JB170 TaxID=1434842 RepID=UPI00097EBD76|nr:SRPBCC domain-containing protein [Sphingobacterium sp. JB170]SJN41896.1 Arabidopsis thaliana genomic DNA, chromosome 3, P1 clone: MEC18 [Sphingobacterium sp. JB170]
MKAFKKYYIISATPEEIFKALTTETTIQLWTGDLVSIDPTEGGAFSMWDGAITGQFITLQPYQKIEQQWYFGDQEDKSIVTIKLHEHKRGTSLELQHTNIPDEEYEDMVDGWNDTYMASLIDFYDE